MQSKHGLASTQNNALEWLEWRHTLRCNNTNPAFARKCCASKVRNTNGRFVRTADLYAKRSEGPVSALHVEMCMVQHLSLRGVFCVHCDWHQCPHQLNSSSHPQKKSVAIPPPDHPRRAAGRGIYRGYNASSVGNFIPSTISRFWASDIPAEYSP